MLWKLSQRTFNGGQLDRRLMGRTDLTKYYQGASVLENFIVKRQGCIVRRRGTVQIADITTVANDTGLAFTRLFPFTYEKQGGYVLIFCESDDNGSRCIIMSKQGVRVSTLTIPYQGTDFDRIGYAQSGDMLYLAHQGYPFARIVRKGDRNWVYEVIDFETLGNARIPAKPTITSITKQGQWPSSGSSQSSAYRVTAVINGVESLPSDVQTISYNLPWPAGGTVEITIANQNPKPDCYNVYKEMIGGSWGLIGTTSVSTTQSAGGTETKVTVLPSVTFGTFTTVKSYKWASVGTVDPSPMRSSAASQDGSYTGGYVCTNGSFRLDYGTSGKYIGVLKLGLGWCGRTSIGGGYHSSGYDSTVTVQYLPCLANYIKAVVTFTDNTTTTIGPVAVPDAAHVGYQSSTKSGSSPQNASSYQNAWVDDHAIGATVDLVIYGRGAVDVKNVKTIVVTAYTDEECTTVATGSCGTSGNYYQLSGNPLVINAVYATVFPLVNQTGNIFIDEYITPDASLTPPKYEPFFDVVDKYPGCVAIYQQRLALAATYAQPFTFWLSCIGDLYNFNVHDSIREDDAMEVTLPATKYPDINHMVLNRDLIMFCDSGEWIVSPVSGNTLTYKTISSKIQSQIGCSKELAPIVVGDDVIFLNMTNEMLIAIKYSYATDGYEATDLSVLSQDIFRGNEVTSIAYKQNPDSIIVVTLADGTFATLEYMKEHEVIAWSHHRLGGNLKALYCCADGSITDGTTDVYILAQDMDVTDSIKLYLLRVKEDADFTDVASAVSLDQMTTTTPQATRAVPTGFVAVDTETAEVISSNGLMTANRTYVLGRPFDARFVSVKPEPNANETVRFEVKNPTEAEVCITEGSSFRIGQYGLPETKDRTIFADPTVDASGRIQLQTVDKSTIITGANNRDGRMRIVSDGVWPLTILSLSTTYQVEMANQDPQKPQGRGESDD